MHKTGHACKKNPKKPTRTLEVVNPACLRTHAVILQATVRCECTKCYLQHVVDDVEFDDGLPSDQVVHHGVIEVMRHGEGQQQDQGLQYVTHMRWLQQLRPTDQEEGIKHTRR